jgi:hypothetical protein
MQRLYFAGMLVLLFAACKKEVSDQAAARLFEQIDPAQSGVQFTNTITENHYVNIITNPYMYNGGGVAIIDANRDGLPDVYFLSNQESNRLFLNKGAFQFEDVTDKAGLAAIGGFKTGVTVADVNGDGWDDIYICRTGLDPAPERGNLLFINNGDLTFTEKAAEYGINDMSASNHANFFDYDLDGDLDLYVLNYPADFSGVNQIRLKEENGKQVRDDQFTNYTDSDHLYRNEGGGVFKDLSQSAGILNRAHGLSATVSDFNQDGFPDIFVGNDYIEPDHLYINNQNGTFTDRINEYLRHQSNNTMGVDIADFNNDALADIVTLDMIAEDNRRQKLLMTTMLTQRYETLVKYGYSRQLMRNTLQLNLGNGQFSEIGLMAGISNTDWSWSPLMADFDNDGWKDIYATNGLRRDITNMDYQTYTADSINRLGGITARRFPDFNDYLKLIPSEPLPNYLFRNRGDLTFEKTTAAWGLEIPSFSNGSAWADLDGDGDLDLVVNNIDAPAFLFRNLSVESGKANRLQIALEGNAPNTHGIGASVTIVQGQMAQYLEMTPTRGFLSSSQHLFHFGLPSNAAIDRVEVRWPGGAMQTLTNVQPNQRLLLKQSEATEHYQSGAGARPATLLQPAHNMGLDFVHQENAFEDFDREFLLPHRFSTLGPGITVGDVNGDGLEDFFIGGASGQAGALYLQQPNSAFTRSAQPAFEADRNYEDAGAVLFDADGDKDPDLYVVSGGSEYPLNDDYYQDRLYLNDGKGNFSRATDALPRITASGYCVEAHDFDGDGDLDLFVGGRVSPGYYPTSPQSFVLRNEGGRFTDATDQAAPEFRNIGMVTGLRWGDLDGDGAPELVASGEWMPITVFKAENSQLRNATEAFGLSGTNGWWNCLALADADADGDLDILAGNLGLNTRLKAPLKLYARDFDGNGSIDPVISFMENDKEYPLPRRENLIKQLPGLKKKFVYYGPYSVATMQDIFSANELRQAQVLEANEFRTTLFLNQGKGVFQPQPLPLEAQLSPTMQFLAEDLNGDGHTDILLAGNSYGADTESGPYDAGNGLVLPGDGKGGFRPLHGKESGFWASKDAKDLKAVQLANGKRLYLVGNNNGVVQGWIERGEKLRR